jgi:PAS domain S-box-containing protein
MPPSGPTPSAPEEEAQELHEKLRDVERDLAKQMRIVEALGSSSPDFIYVFDLDQRFVYASPPLLSLWGKTLDEVVGKSFEDLGYPSHLVQLHRAQLGEALTGKTVSGASCYTGADGALRHYEYKFVPVLRNDGRIESVVGTTRDVTAQVRAEQERTTVVAALTESEAQLLHFADAIPQLAWIARADGHIVWYNRRWYEYTGTRPEDMEGWGWQSVHDPDELPKVIENWSRSLASGETFEMSFPLRGADGRFRLFLTRVHPMVDAAGRVMRWFGTNTDIEAQRQAIVERDLALAAAQEASRAKDEFLAMLGHELRNPLAPIMTVLQLLETREAKTREWQIVDRQVQHLARLVDDLLDVARITRGEVELRRGPMEVAGAVLRGVEMASPLLGRRAQEIVLDVPPEGLLISADADRLAQVVSNLVTNACKFSPKGAQVAVTAEKHDAIIRVIVRDQGIGITPELLGSIFEAFVQKRQAIDRSSGGLGLGLSIVKNLVELHGGAVYARSDGPGKGSEFIIELPALAVEGETLSPPPLAEAPAGGGGHHSRILVVDDNQDAADLLADFLAGEGFDVRVAHDPPSALAIAPTFRPEIALLDIGLPVMDGWELGSGCAPSRPAATSSSSP